MMIFRHLALGVAASALAFAGSAQAITLGAFEFDNGEFGDTLLESDGGAFSASNWLNVANADPGNPGYLTGASFDTGIANIGLSGTPSYTIGYTGGVDNGSGDDFGIVTARYSVSDAITIEFSLDGITFSGPIVLGSGLAVSTGVNKSYYYGGGGPFDSTLFVTSIDLSDYGFGAGDTIKAARITGSPELDLIRVAGLGAAVPEPTTWALMIAGFGLAGAGLRRRRAAVA